MTNKPLPPVLTRVLSQRVPRSGKPLMGARHLRVSHQRRAVLHASGGGIACLVQQIAVAHAADRVAGVAVHHLVECCPRSGYEAAGVGQGAQLRQREPVLRVDPQRLEVGQACRRVLPLGRQPASAGKRGVDHLRHRRGPRLGAASDKRSKAPGLHPKRGAA